jgi:hypothetical protein
MFLKKVFHGAAVNQHPPVHHSGWMVQLKNEKRKRKKSRWLIEAPHPTSLTLPI